VDNEWDGTCMHLSTILTIALVSVRRVLVRPVQVTSPSFVLDLQACKMSCVDAFQKKSTGSAVTRMESEWHLHWGVP
jgi:hypothetical protein